MFFKLYEKEFFSYPKDERETAYYQFLERRSNKKIKFRYNGIYKERIFRKEILVVEFVKTFNIKIYSKEAERIWQNEDLLKERYESEFEKTIEDKSLEESMKQIYFRKFAAKKIKEEIIDGTITSEKTIQSPKLKVLDENYRQVAEEFCSAFNETFKDFNAEIIN